VGVKLGVSSGEVGRERVCSWVWMGVKVGADMREVDCEQGHIKLSASGNA
jgi:hypothetical protein